MFIYFVPLFKQYTCTSFDITCVGYSKRINTKQLQLMTHKAQMMQHNLEIFIFQHYFVHWIIYLNASSSFIFQSNNSINNENLQNIKHDENIIHKWSHRSVKRDTIYTLECHPSNE